MKKQKRILALVLAILMLAVILVACGDDDSKNNTPAGNDATTATQSQDPTDLTDPPLTPATEAQEIPLTSTEGEWGDYSFLIPEGFELTEAGEFSSYDFALKKSDFYYFDFNTEADDEQMMQHYNYNKNTYINEQVDFEIAYDDNTWTGFQYSDGFGGYGFEAYTTIDGKIVRVSSAGYQYDSAFADMILASFAKK